MLKFFTMSIIRTKLTEQHKWFINGQQGNKKSSKRRDRWFHFFQQKLATMWRLYNIGHFHLYKLTAANENFYTNLGCVSVCVHQKTSVSTCEFMHTCKFPLTSQHTLESIFPKCSEPILLARCPYSGLLWKYSRSLRRAAIMSTLLLISAWERFTTPIQGNCSLYDFPSRIW